eukprot:6331276-Amphidinium_carterae.1
MARPGNEDEGDLPPPEGGSNMPAHEILNFCIPFGCFAVMSATRLAEMCPMPTLEQSGKIGRQVPPNSPAILGDSLACRESCLLGSSVSQGQALVFWGGLGGMITVPVFSALT